MNIHDLIICPKCRCLLSEDLECSSCKGHYSLRYGVYNLISEELSASQVSHWKIEDEAFENSDAFLKQQAQDDKWDKDYISKKNAETLAAEEKSNQYTETLLKNISGTVCDIATGMGRMLRKLLNASAETQIVCTDIDPKVLAQTRLILKTDDSRVHYVASDGRYLALKDDSFDYVTSFAAFGNVPDTDIVARELYRILKPGGKMIVQGIYIEKGSKSHELAKQYNLEKGLVEEYLIECLSNIGFKNIESTIVASAVWAENPYDLIPAAGDIQKFSVIQAVKPKTPL